MISSRDWPSAAKFIEEALESPSNRCQKHPTELDYHGAARVSGQTKEFSRRIAMMPQARTTSQKITPQEGS